MRRENHGNREPGANRTKEEQVALLEASIQRHLVESDDDESNTGEEDMVNAEDVHDVTRQVHSRVLSQATTETEANATESLQAPDLVTVDGQNSCAPPTAMISF